MSDGTLTPRETRLALAVATLKDACIAYANAEYAQRQTNPAAAGQHLAVGPALRIAVLRLVEDVPLYDILGLRGVPQ